MKIQFQESYLKTRLKGSVFSPYLHLIRSYAYKCDFSHFQSLISKNFTLLGSKQTYQAMKQQLVQLFLSTPFSGIRLL